MAHLLRTGWFRPCTSRQWMPASSGHALGASDLVARLKDIENSVRGLLRGFGLRLPHSCAAAGMPECASSLPDTPPCSHILEPLLAARGALREQRISLDKRVRDAAKADGSVAG